MLSFLEETNLLIENFFIIAIDLLIAVLFIAAISLLVSLTLLTVIEFSFVTYFLGYLFFYIC